MDKTLFSAKQIEFIVNCHHKFNLAHGSVRCGKTFATLFAFLKLICECPGEQIALIGYSISTIYQNVVSLIFTSPIFSIFKPYCTWSKHEKRLTVGNKVVTCFGAGDEGALGTIQGITMDLCYCDEMTLYPDNVLDMIKTRLSPDHAKMIGSMNPKHPEHKVKKWIDFAKTDDNYYALHFTLDDNPYISQNYKDDLKKTLSGVFLKRNYFGLWCVAEGAVFDFFDRDMHVVKPHQLPCAEYFIAGIDFGTKNPTSCILLGVTTGESTQSGAKMWVEDEYYWDPSVTGRQKTISELANDIQAFLYDYGVKSIYIDPSAAAMKEEFRRKRMHMVDANNKVFEGIQIMTSKMAKGDLLISDKCFNLIAEIEGYVWDEKKAQKLGIDAPIKNKDHAIDAMRYAVATHRIPKYTAKEPFYPNEPRRFWP